MNPITPSRAPDGLPRVIAMPPSVPGEPPDHLPGPPPTPQPIQPDEPFPHNPEQDPPFSDPPGPIKEPPRSPDEPGTNTPYFDQRDRGAVSLNPSTPGALLAGLVGQRMPRHWRIGGWIISH
ncbi:hypothetical protein JCM19000A_11450 [Silvimonas sp. JCM 19000]